MHMVRKKLLRCCRQDSDREIYKKRKKGGRIRDERTIITR